MGGKTSYESIQKYKKKTYDRIVLDVKKGQKDVIMAHAASKGMSMNGYINKLLVDDMGDLLIIPSSDTSKTS